MNIKLKENKQSKNRNTHNRSLHGIQKEEKRSLINDAGEMSYLYGCRDHSFYSIYC